MNGKPKNNMPAAGAESPVYTFRVRFSRDEEIKYISHLDLMRLFERAIRRSRLPLDFSRGFNPHPQMVFGLPLSVGVTSQAEYADLDFTEYLEPKELVRILNENLPDGIRILEAGPKRTEGNIMAQITKASYAVGISTPNESSDENECKGELGPQALAEGLEELLSQDEILVRKEGKNGVKTVNIRPDIYKAEVGTGENDGESFILLNLLVGAGSARNVRPEWVVEALGRHMGKQLEVSFIHRTGLFLGTDRVADPITGKSTGTDSFEFPKTCLIFGK